MRIIVLVLLSTLWVESEGSKRKFIVRYIPDSPKVEPSCDNLKLRNPQAWTDKVITDCRVLVDPDKNPRKQGLYQITVDVTRLRPDNRTLNYPDMVWLTNNALNKQSKRCATATYNVRGTDPQVYSASYNPKHLLFVLYAPAGQDECAKLRQKLLLKKKLKITACKVDVRKGNFAYQYRLAIDMRTGKRPHDHLFDKYLQADLLSELNSPETTCRYNGYFTKMNEHIVKEPITGPPPKGPPKPAGPQAGPPPFPGAVPWYVHGPPAGPPGGYPPGPPHGPLPPGPPSWHPQGSPSGPALTTPVIVRPQSPASSKPSDVNPHGLIRNPPVSEHAAGLPQGPSPPKHVPSNPPGPPPKSAPTNPPGPPPKLTPTNPPEPPPKLAPTNPPGPPPKSAPTNPPGPPPKLTPTNPPEPPPKTASQIPTLGTARTASQIPTLGTTWTASQIPTLGTTWTASQIPTLGTTRTASRTPPGTSPPSSLEITVTIA
ncbi:hypothetical protein P879_04473 [Paragonimus westermani]|uniref:Uncharacterized protein n=1 Tax=Paragonimus westermani TaxID=34504 RepID=A0A8T0DG59_9TREM|nr:hypothetical protein P879_04473 [Paragonimus westermani]